jgi:hypothetical protein
VVPYGLSTSPPEGRLLALWLGLPAVVVAGLLVAAWRRPPRRAALVATALVVAVVNGALDTPLHVGDVVVRPLLHGRSLYAHDTPDGRGLTPALLQGLTWEREHLPVSAVIAVNNQFSDRGLTSADYYYYSAFGERRVFLEGWYDTVAAANLANPDQIPSSFRPRLLLNDAVFWTGSRTALGVMERRYGVGYLLFDLAHGPVPPDLSQLGHVIFHNRGMILARVLPVSSPA